MIGQGYDPLLAAPGHIVGHPGPDICGDLERIAPCLGPAPHCPGRTSGIGLTAGVLVLAVDLQGFLMGLHFMQLLLLAVLLFAMTGCATVRPGPPRMNWYQRISNTEDNASQLLRKECRGLNQESNQDFYKLESE